MSKAGRNTGSAGMELHGMDCAASRARAGDKSHLFIDQTKGQLITSIINIIKNIFDLTIKSLIAPTKNATKRNSNLINAGYNYCAKRLHKLDNLDFLAASALRSL